MRQIENVRKSWVEEIASHLKQWKSKKKIHKRMDKLARNRKRQLNIYECICKKMRLDKGFINVLYVGV